MVNVYVPAFVRVPEISPVLLLSFRPSGSFPVLTFHLYGDFPPETLYRRLNDAFLAAVIDWTGEAFLGAATEDDDDALPIVVLVAVNVNCLGFSGRAPYLSVAVTANV